MDVAFSIRPATPTDRGAVDRLLGRSYPALMADAYEAHILRAALTRIARANPALLASGRYYAACARDGALLGVGGWTETSPSEQATSTAAHLRHFATDPECLGQGIGRAIFEHCVQAARSAGIARLEVFASLNATGFYAAMGFEEARRVTLDLGGELPFPAVLMHRTI